MANATLVAEKIKGLPEEDSAVLQRYAMWNPQVPGLIQERIKCGQCSHCTPGEAPQKSNPGKPEKEPNPGKPKRTNPVPSKEPKRDMLRYLHGECHCHPCGSLIPDALREREQSRY